MKTVRLKLDNTIQNASFTALLCTSLGFLMLQTLLIRSDASRGVHVANVLIGITASMVIYRCIIGYWSAAGPFTPGADHVENKILYSISHLMPALLLVVVGYIGAKFLCNGSATASALYVIFLLIFPWSRIGLCRRSLAASSAMICLGQIAGLLTAGQLPHQVVLGVSVWMLWLAAIGTWLRLILLRLEKSKSLQSSPPSTVDNPPVVASN